MKQGVADMKQEVADMKQGLADMKQEVADMKQEVADMKQEVADMRQWLADMKLVKGGMKLEINTLKFGLQSFAGDDDDVRFYTGFPSYSTLTNFYEFLPPSATQLNYWGSDNTENRPISDVRCGHCRKLKPINEMFWKMTWRSI